MTRASDPFERWPDLDELLARAIEMPADVRVAFLRSVAARDAELCTELERLLAAHSEAGDFMEDRIAWLGDDGGTDAFAAPPSLRWVGRTIGHYEILESLGGGGMGVVFRARDTKLDRPVALKFLRPQLEDEPALALRFLNEAQAASALDHPNICTIYEIGEAPGGESYIAMAYYAGETLAQRLERGAIPVDEALQIAMQIGEGTARAHEAGIVHRDLKPANLMLTDRGAVKILDFGIAKLAGGPSPATRTGSRIGTVAYMSPEQARGEPVDHRADIWALGVVLYEMVTGRNPFRGANDQATLNAIFHGEPEPTGIGLAGLDAVIRTALAPHADRFADMPEMLDALNSLMTGDILPRTVVRRRRSRRVWLAGIGMASIVAAIGAGIVLTRGTEQAAEPRTPRLIVLPFENLGEPEDAYFADGLTDEIIRRLASISELRVLARTTAHQVRDAGWPLTALADSLGVSYALEGTVRWASGGGLVRVTTSFVQVPDGVTLWTEPLDAEFADVFQLQDQIAERVALRLQVRLPAGGQPAAVVPEAYDAYLLGQYHLNSRTAAGLRAAADYFGRSIAADSTFAPAWAGLAGTLGLFPTYGIDSLPPDEAVRRAESAALRALEIDPGLAEGHTVLGGLYMNAWDWDASIAAHERAIQLKPQLAQAYHWNAEALYSKGEYEAAERALTRALELDPLSPVVNNTMGWLLRVAGRVDEAIPFLERAHELSPDFAFPHFNLLAIDALAGRWETARDHAIRTVQAFGLDAARADTVARALGAADPSAIDRAIAVLERWGRESSTPSILIASLLDILATPEHAIPWVLEAYREQVATPMDVVYLLRKHRADPRAAAILAELGLDR